METTDAIAARLKQARLMAGFRSATDAANSLGVKYQTYAAHENGNRGIETKSIALYARRYNVSVDWLLRGKGEGPVQENQPTTVEHLPDVKKTIDRIAVIGKVAANAWIDVEEMDFDHDSVEYVPSLSGYPVHAQFALRVDGNCLNKVAAHNDILVCVSKTYEGVDILENDLVIVERRKFGGQMVERTAKRLRMSKNGVELWPESTDPSHQEPIALYDTPEGVDVEIVGKVIWILRRP